MARLNLTVPDDLFERLEKHRDRLNMSRICAEALEKKVREIEKEAELLQSLRRDVDQMNSMIVRLKDEKDERMRYCFEQGVDSAQGWAQGASYSDLKSWWTKAAILIDQVQEIQYSPPLPDAVKSGWMKIPVSERTPMDLDEEKEVANGFYLTVIEYWRVLEPRIS